MRKMLFCATALALACSCGGGKKENMAKIDGLEFDSVVVDTTIALAENEGSPTCHLRLNVQYAKGKNADSINNSIMKAGILVPDYLILHNEKMDMRGAVGFFVDKFLSDYKKEYGELYRQDKEHAMAYNYEYLVNTYSQNGKDGSMSYVAEVYNYAGGAHGSSQTIVKNINPKSGKVQMLSDIFVPGYEQGLTELIVNRMCKKFNAKDLEGLHEQGIFYGIDTYVPDNFILGKDEIIFIYVEDEIAPHAVGEIRVDIPYKELEKLLQK